jgi:GNAT superfamily N-acetyltransferase
MVAVQEVEAALASLGAAPAPTPGTDVELADDFDDAWLRLYRNGELPPVARRVLTHPGARFATVLVVRHLLSDAAARGATDAYLQVAEDNVAALALYGALGFTIHHHYCYLAAP